MTQRKPPGVSFPGWIERQIRVAETEGAFENLTGKGQAIADLDAHSDDLNWILNYLRRENADIAALLPRSLALAKEVELLPERLRTQRYESTVRAIISDLNDRIRAAHRLPSDGPPMRVWIVDIEGAVDRWRIDRTETAATLDVAEPEPVTTPPLTRRRRFSRRAAR